jgi:hypothetical protein
MHLDFWDYLTFLTFFLMGIAGLIVVFFLLGLPGRIAIARKHPDAEAVNLMGWFGFLAVVPWLQAFMWAFKPTDTIDVRRFPAEEARAIQEEIDSLTGRRLPSQEARAIRDEIRDHTGSGEKAPDRKDPTSPSQPGPQG